MKVKLYTQNNEFIEVVTIPPYKKLEHVVVNWGARFFKHRWGDTFEEVILSVPLE